MDAQARSPLSTWEKIVLAYVFLLVIAIGVLVEYRTALLERRMGDLDVFLRAAWAIRNDADPYAVKSDNDWHYLYPPLYAILLTPLADPPPGEDTLGYVPFAWSVAICYLVNVFCLFMAAHVLASALEETSADPNVRAQPRYCVRWWRLRLWPVLVCLWPIGHTLMRGQVNLIVLAMLCAALAGWLRGQNFRAGVWLAFAICIKVIPVYLLVYPLWKRDARTLLGCSAGLLAGLVVIPCLVSGPAKTKTHYETYARVFFGPQFKLTEDDSRTEEILTTDSVGVKNAIHNWTHPDPATRPADLTGAEKIAYLALGIAMTFVTLWRSGNGQPIAQTIGSLIVLMTIFSPVCHSHYLMFCVPIVMGLYASQWQFKETMRVPRLFAMASVVFSATIAIAYLPGCEILKDRCASLFATLPLWAISLALGWRGQTNAAKVGVDATPHPFHMAA